MQNIVFLQSLWAMERRHTDGFERSLEANVEMILEAGFDGVSCDFSNRDIARRISGLVKPHGKKIEAVVYPKTVDEMKPIFEWASQFCVDHINLQPNVRPRRLQDCIPYIDGWQRLAEQVAFPLYFETHRDRMTTDLYFTLDILDHYPNLKLLGDLSHFLVGREFAWPVSEVDQKDIYRVLENCWAFHGRVASSEQIQIEISFPHHKMWLELFISWWEQGFRSWRRRAGQNDTLVFTCELGPQPYAITGRDGNDTTDRWEEALLLRKHVQAAWDRVAKE